jgi:NitT/TauT family transport system substrate-binding protein
MRQLGIIAAALIFSTSAFQVGSAHAADKVTFVLDWFPSGEVAFPYVGVKEGFFAAENLDVQIDIGRGGADAVTRIASGTDDFGGAALNPLMVAAAEGAIPVKAVMSVFTKQPDAIFTVDGSPVTSIKALGGKTLATATFSSSNPLWPVIAQANGLDPATVKLLKVDDNALGPMLALGKVDAVISWVTSAPNDARLLKASNKALKVIPWSDHGLNGYGWSILASDKIIHDSPDKVARFVRAYLKTVQFYAANPQKVAEDLKAMVPQADLQSNADEAKAAGPLVKNEITDRDGFGAFNPQLLKDTWIWVAKAQNYPLDKVDPEKLVDRSFVKK